jgi:hypothetical protein
VQAPPGSSGLIVVSPTPGGGTTTAYGCSAVVVQGASSEVRQAPPCAQQQQAPMPEKSRYAPDPGRKAAIIAAPIVYGLATVVTGMQILTADRDQDRTTGLIAYGTVQTIVPSVPRMVVGDLGTAMVYGLVRGGSVAVASLVDWGKGDGAWQGPFYLGFLLPVTLGIVDLALTPHREDLAPKPGVASISASPVIDRNGAQGAQLNVAGVF